MGEEAPEGALVRVDRESGSPLGSPYLWEEERERTQACDAYARLMRSTMRHGGRACDGEWVRKVGRMAGYWGRVGEGEGVRESCAITCACTAGLDGSGLRSACRAGVQV